MKKDTYEQLDPKDFVLVDQDKKKYDKKFETKPIGYFKDAMMRFAVNKTNVVATVILATLVLLGIFVPIFTTKNIYRQEMHLGHLPPRIPILEKIGIADGYIRVRAQRVDLSTIDDPEIQALVPQPGLGIPNPNSYRPEFIDWDTLINFPVGCTDTLPDCRGGTVTMQLQSEFYIVQTRTGTDPHTGEDYQHATFDPDLNPYILLDLLSFTEGFDVELNVYVRIEGVFEQVANITEYGDGFYRIYPFEELAHNETFTSPIRLELTSEENIVASAALNEIAVYQDDLDNPLEDDPDNPEANKELLAYYAGYDLARFERVAAGGRGRLLRRGGQLLMARFQYDIYGFRFSERLVRSMSPDRLEGLLDMGECIQVDDPDNPDGWMYEGMCPVIKVGERLVQQISVPGFEREEITYRNVIINYGMASGFEEPPYFLFGTTRQGMDLFGVTWLALRTSLIIGMTVAFINITVGIVYGAISGYYGGKVDILMERFSEIVGRVPWLVWLSIFVALIGPGVLSLILILIVSGWIGVSSTTRTQFYRFKGREYVLSSRTLGAKDSRLIFRHILPNGIGTIITTSILMIPFVIFSEATISYLGFGIGYGQSFKLFGLLELSGVSIGVLLQEGRNYMLIHPNLVAFPAIIISILMITFNLFGNALRDAFNPSLRGSE